MTVAVELAQTYNRQFGVGVRFTLADAYKARPDIWPKSLRNITADLVSLGVLNRVGRGKYEVRPMPLMELERRINNLGDPGYYRHINLSGPRSRVPKGYTAKVRKINAKWREPLFKAQDAVCALCGCWMIHPIHTAVDHYIPLGGEGEDTPANLVLMHHGCNAAKSDKDYFAAQDYLESKGHLMRRHQAAEAFDLGINLGATCERNWYDN